jgi:hypothetical protein
MNKNKLNQNLFSLIIYSILIFITSCGSFEGVSYYYADGIYENENLLETQLSNTSYKNSTEQSSNYYENYFKNFSNDYQDQPNDVNNTINENDNIYIIDNSPNLRMRFGFNNFDYWNNWSFNGFGFPYNNFSNNGLFWPYYNPYWDYGYQGMYFNNAWGYGYSLFGWNNYNPYSYISSNRGRFGRKVAYNRGSTGRNSLNTIRSNSSKNYRSTNNVGRNLGENKFIRSSGRRINSNYNSRINNRSNTRSSSFSGNRSSGSIRSSSGSRSSRGGRKN